MNKKRFVDYQEDLIHELQNHEEAREYINAALQDEDERVFLLALKDVLEAQGGDMTWLSKKTKLNRENLYRVLSHKGNPKITSLKSILNALGLELAVQVHHKK